MSRSIMKLIIEDKKETRKLTLDITKKLSIEQLDFNFDEISNSIGTLLFHIATLEYRFIVNNIFVRQMTLEEFNKYEMGFPHKMSGRLINRNDFKYYQELLNYTEDLVLQGLSELDDGWLFKSSGFQTSSSQFNNNYSFLRHIIDDEINHQGQIKLIIRRLPFFCVILSMNLIF